MDKENTDGQPAKLYWNKETGELFTDRKSVVQGKSVDLGGRRIIKKIFFQAEDGIRDSAV